MFNRPTYEVRDNPHNPELCDLYVDGKLLTPAISGSERGWIEDQIERLKAMEVRDAT